MGMGVPDCVDSCGGGDIFESGLDTRLLSRDDLSAFG